MKKILLSTVSAAVIIGGAIGFALPKFTEDKMDNVYNETQNNNETLSNLNVPAENVVNEEIKEEENNSLIESVISNETETTEKNEGTKISSKEENTTSSTANNDNEKQEVENSNNDPVETEEKQEQSQEVKDPVVTPEVTAPTEDETKEEKQPEIAQDNNKVSEETTKPVENYADVIENEVKKVLDANSAHYILKHEGYFNTKDEIWYNKSANRRLGIFDEKVKEYIEGIPGRQVIDSKFSSYYYQDRWQYTNETQKWEKQVSLYSGFGISSLTLLKDIKTAELVNNRPFNDYVVTIDKDVANKAAENLYNRVNTFKNDIKLYVSVDKKTGYIIHIDSYWKNEDFTDPSKSFTMCLVIANVNKTTVERPKELKDVVITDREKPNELTATKKQEYARLIEKAYANTRDANSLTYTLNGKTMAYDKSKNEALLTDGNSQTYYKGTAGLYVDHNYVGPTYHQDSWTKTNGTWTKNVRKHTTFTPQELYFLNHIFTVNKVEKNNDITTYTVEILKYDANLAYSHVYGVNNKFADNLEFTVSVDNSGYVRSININSGDFKMDLAINNINNTKVTKPQDLKID